MKVIINGAAGYMGREVTKLVSAACRGSELAARVDISGADGCYKALAEYSGPADVIIDFSHHSAVAEIMGYAVKRGIAVIVATTGHDDSEKAIIHAAAEKIPVFFSANMSLGVALLAELAAKTAVMFPDADVEIVETHHNRKLDAPSGTALFLANEVSAARGGAPITTGRSGHCVREKGEIGVSSVRRGNIAGIHEVIVSTNSETISIKHDVHDRALFADGAMAAAEFIVKCGPGLYNMQDMIKSGGN